MPYVMIPAFPPSHQPLPVTPDSQLALPIQPIPCKPGECGGEVPEGREEPEPLASVNLQCSLLGLAQWEKPLFLMSLGE